VTFDEPNYVLVDEITTEVIWEATKRPATAGKLRDEVGDPPWRATKGRGEILRFAQNDSGLATVWHRRPGGAPTGETPVPHLVAAAGESPVVTATRRRDNGPPDEVEIVLDRPIPYNATTRFTFDDGVAVNIVEFAFAPGDTDGDGDADLADFAWLANCMDAAAHGPPDETPGPCLALDADMDTAITPADWGALLSAFAGP
jgi:hypothetical protein